jgi:hypothetical protein
MAFGPAVAPARAAAERKYVYLATAETWGWTNAFERTPTPLGEPAPMGEVIVQAIGTTITLHIDDAGTPDGLEIPVQVHSDGRWGFKGCMPVRSVQTMRAVPGEWVTIAFGPRRSGETCSGIGSGGIATIGGVK